MSNETIVISVYQQGNEKRQSPTFSMVYGYSLYLDYLLYDESLAVTQMRGISLTCEDDIGPKYHVEVS
jgi:hypothetical protein